MQVADMHCDTISEILNRRRRQEECELWQNNLHVDLKRMKENGYLIQNFALFTDIRKCSKSPWEEVNALYQVYRQELLSNEEIISPVYAYEDIEKNRRAGKLSAMLTVEEGAVCGNDMEKLHCLYDMGVRMLTLTWNYPNGLGHPNINMDEKTSLYAPEREMGLTETGREFVAGMNALGMVVDVSHLSDAGFYDVLECSKKPVVASHSNARTICGCVRNLTDDMIRKLAEQGGCMGLNFYGDFLDENGDGGLAAVVRHAKHIVQTGGVEVLGLGSDFDGIRTNGELPGAESMGVLWDALHREGFTQGQLERIFSQNVLRIYRDIL